MNPWEFLLWLFGRSGKFLLALFSTVILGFKSNVTHGHILLSQVEVKVTLRLAVYRQSLHLGVKPLETHEQRFFFSKLNSCGNSPYVTSSLVCQL
jgi:hypothetical protein